MGARVTVRRSRSARVARLAGALSLPILVLTALGHRFGLIPELSMLMLVSLGFGLAIVAMAFGTYALHDIWVNGHGGAGSAILGVVYAVPGIALFAAAVYGLAAYPQLNDVSTDLVDPPEYLTLSGMPPGRAELPAEESRELQLAAYPDITARRYPVNINRVYEAVRMLVDERGWQVIAEIPPDPDARQAVVQALARTLLFHFTDHVVIRIEGEPAATRVDIRSASSLGRHDLGQNARRIRRFLGDLDGTLQGERTDLQSASQ